MPPTDEDLKRNYEVRIECLEQEVELQRDIRFRYENALLWIRYLAGLHYLGDAFDAEHMRSLSNIAADTLWLDSERDLPDFVDTSDEAQEKAREWVDQMHKIIDRPDDGPYGDAGDVDGETEQASD